MSAVEMSKTETRMEFLAGIIRSLSSEEIFCLLDQVFPGMDESQKEDLHDVILASRDGVIDRSQCVSATDFFDHLAGKTVARE